MTVSRGSRETPASATSRRLDVLVRASEAVHSAPDLRGILRRMVEFALELVTGEAGTFGLHAGGKMVFTDYIRDGKWREIDLVFERGGGGVPGWVMEHRRAYVSNDVASDPVPRQDLAASMGFRKLVEVPLFDEQGELLGAFELHDKLGGRDYDDEDLEVLKGLAALTATAVENERSRRRAEKAEERARILVEVSAVLAEAEDPRRALERVARLLVPSVADWCTFVAADADGVLRRVAVVHRDPQKAPLAEAYLRDFPPTEHRAPTVDDIVHAPYGLLERDITHARIAAFAQCERQVEVIEALGADSALMVPMVVRGVAHGILSLNNVDKSRVLDESDLSFAREVAVRAALALENARRFEEERRARRHMTILAAAAGVLAQDATAAEMLERIARAVVGDFCDNCMFYVVDGEGLARQVAAASTDVRIEGLLRALATLTPRPGRSYVKDAVSTGRPVYEPDIPRSYFDSLPAAHRADVEALTPRAVIAVPLVSRGRVVGAGLFGMAHSERRFSPGDVEVATELGRRAGLMVDNALLLEAERAASRRATRLQAVTAALSRSIGAEEAALAVTRETLPLLDARGSALFLVEGDDVVLRLDLCAASELDEPGRVGPRRALAKRVPACDAVREARLVWAATPEDIDARWPSLEAARVARGAQAWGAVPLVYEGHCIGALSFYCTTPRQVSPDEADFLLAVGAQCAQALVRARLYDEAREARERSEAAGRAKDEFLAMLGHELRNPLAPISTAVQLLKLRGDDATARERSILERQVNHLMRLVDDLLDVSRIARGIVQLKRAPVEMAEVVARAVEMASALVEQRQHELRVDVPRRELRVDGDETRLAQVIANLVTNAAKYTEPKGVIDIRAARDGDDVVLTVRDTGIGIDHQLLPQVFDLFVQGRRGGDGTHGGLGLGLTLARSLVELHGGTITAESAGAGHGSTFTVRLPAHVAGRAGADAAATTRTSRGTATPRHVLVVDDNADAAELLAEVLATVGHTVTVALDGPRALDEVARRRPDVAILDIAMPVMDGYELATKIREIASPAPRLVALTGFGQDQDRQRSKDAGFDDHLTKPVDFERLLALVEG